MKTLRKIKFRAYSSDNKQMVYQNNLGFFECLFKWKSNNQTCQLNVALKEPTVNVMQYTGLTDKNGIEVYEGDIVKHERFDVKLGGYIKSNHEVYFDTELCEFGLKNSFALFHNQFSDEFEVIGNIFQTKTQN